MRALLFVDRDRRNYNVSVQSVHNGANQLIIKLNFDFVQQQFYKFVPLTYSSDQPQSLFHNLLFYLMKKLLVSNFCTTKIHREKSKVIATAKQNNSRNHYQKNKNKISCQIPMRISTFSHLRNLDFNNYSTF